ncbi:glycoside hydrolase family 3 C-terminal domain-containing protein [Tessaracoccus sp.]|uniref:glycoside hydrolase family 3 C-terminal domain-containing protein n=1 Tax=Tessaracoccus sp. TaxID=1971211 RepID=UPI002608F7B3|nr:glycoside hydrolase family 3 C-terminal domain-containing protein [Tessaracoccus sp.]
MTPGALLPGPDAIPSSFFRTPDGERGLRGEFWTNTTLDGDPFLVRNEAPVEFNLGFHNFPGFNASSPRYERLPGELNGQCSMRFTGTLTVPVTGVYDFAITHLGSYSFSLDGVSYAAEKTEREPEGAAPVAPMAGSGFAGSGGLNGGGGDGATTTEWISLTLEAGHAYDFQFDYAADDPSQGFLLGPRVRLGWVPPQGVFAPEVEEAAALARDADVAVVVVRTYEAEADDRPHMGLPSGQDDMVKAVLATGTPTVLVLMTGSPIDTTKWDGQPAALLQAWFPGQAQGDALARVLIGAAEPGGRLPVTIPASIDDTPAADKRTYPGVDGSVYYDEGVFVGYRAVSADGPAPAYHFGHGLGYTTFGYADLEVSEGEGDDVATVAVTVTNTGEREGSEVVQVYVGELPVPVKTPERQLAGFSKVRLAPGASQRVEIAVPLRAVSYFDADAHDWASASGEVTPARRRVVERYPPLRRRRGLPGASMTTDATAARPWFDTTISADERLALLAEMTLAEKAGLLFHTMIGLSDLTEPNPLISAPSAVELVRGRQLTHFNLVGGPTPRGRSPPGTTSSSASPARPVSASR